MGEILSQSACERTGRERPLGYVGWKTVRANLNVA
jgi:hypothetical protein